MMPGQDKKPRAGFDADLSPDNEKNRKAAKEQRLVFDRTKGVYRDADGCPRRDRYGQPLG
jgi:hypothetical protein